MISIRDKVSLESIKSSALDQARSVAQSAVSSLIGAAQSYITGLVSNVVNNVTGVIGPALSLLNTGRFLFTRARGTISKLTKASAGDVKNILDPESASILPIPFLPDDIPTTLPSLDSDILPIFTQTLTRIKSLGTEGVLDLYKMFESLAAKQLEAGDEVSIGLEDNFSDIFQSMPITNDPLPENISAVANAKSFNKFFQATSIEEKINLLTKLDGSSYGEIKYIRNKLKALQESNEMYEEIIDSPFIADVSDLIGLVTVGHTIDTPALDPEDWAGGASKISNPDGRLSFGPAKIIPVTSKYKARDEIAKNMQESYEQINEQMYYNLYRDRYYNDDLNNGQYLDYGVNRYDLEDSDKYGFAKLSVSHMNMGDYSSIGFAKINHDESSEIIEGVNGSIEIIPLIGYIQNINNLNVITVKPAYQVTIDGVEIPVDSRGNRNILSASKPDETVVNI